MTDIKYKQVVAYINGRAYQIITPVKKYEGLYVCNVDKNAYVIFGDKTTLLSISDYINYLSVKENVILYIPAIKDNTQYIKDRFKIDKSFDLVMLSHKVQMRYKDWKKYRDKIRCETKIIEDSYSVQNLGFNCDKFNHKTNLDVFRVHSNYHTLFLTGSIPVFRFASLDFKQVGEDGEQTYKELPGYHEHAHLDVYMNYKDVNNICVDFYDEKIWDK